MTLISRIMKKKLKVHGTFRLRTKAPRDSSKALPLGWFAISHRWIPEESRKRQRGKWWKISSGTSSCYRALTMDPQMEGSPNQSNGQIHIDWNGWLELIGFEGDSDREIELTIEPAGKLAFLSVGTSHPDPGIRAAAIIAGISVGMGLLSIVIAVSQFFT